jgi:hypothetical protein|tara:strand:- start:662 stop:862 length:201 start_codon:yes stop_codon:yes gene_type:complete
MYIFVDERERYIERERDRERREREREREREIEIKIVPNASCPLFSTSIYHMFSKLACILQYNYEET